MTVQQPRKPKSVQHGYDCVKIVHTRGGYLHDALDDRPYEVDGVKYCGRCHEYLGTSREHSHD